MPKTVTLRIMRYLGDGPNARPHKVVVMRRFMDEHRNQIVSRDVEPRMTFDVNLLDVGVKV